MSSWTGWGGVKVGSVEFPYSRASITFDPVDVRNTTISGSVIVHSKGWRVIIDMELIVASESDAQNLASVALLASQSQADGQSINIYPRYTSTDAGSLLSYACFIDSGFSPQDIAQVDVGQTISLRWISASLLGILPNNYSSQVEEGWIDDGSDTYIDENADTYNLF